MESEAGMNQPRFLFALHANISVVVIKFEPEKSGNSMEDKTQMILHKLQACKSCDSRYLFKRNY